MPKRRAASRWLSPSTWQAWRTRPYSSTESIPAFPGSFRTSQGKPCRGTTLHRHGRTTQPPQWHLFPAPLSKTRRTFTDEFKREAVSLLAGSGRPLTQVATELGIQPSMLRAWRGNGTMAAGLYPSRHAQPVAPPRCVSRTGRGYYRLQKELDRAQMERDIQK